LDDPAYGEFKIPDESCHLIEIYAEDNVEKNSTHKQCVFVDNSVPEPDKTVGKPRTEWYPTTDLYDPDRTKFYPEIVDKCWKDEVGNVLTENQCKLDQWCIECWKVTLRTPMSLDCIDPEPHPVDHEEVCFNVENDTLDVTEKYCTQYQGDYDKYRDGFCCLDKIENFLFLEDTEHNLEYYCVDALHNKGEKIDEEKFLVEGEPFEIQINTKWNLISVPFMLINDDISVVLKDVEDSIDSVWTYDPQHLICSQDWCVYTPDGNNANDNLHRMIPGWGYWVLANQGDKLLIGGSWLIPGLTPPGRQLYEGWNLIGYHGTEGLPGYYEPVGDGDYAYCALYTLRNEESIYPPTKWSSLFTYWQPYPSPHLVEYAPCDEMDPGAGYWIWMDEDRGYTRETACPDFVVEAICGF